MKARLPTRRSLNNYSQFINRYRGYRVPISYVKAGTLLQKLAAREQTTSHQILRSVTLPDSEEPKAVGPLTSTEELLEALDLAIGSNGEGLDGYESKESEFASAKAEIEDSDRADVTIATRRKRRTKKEMEVDEEPKFVELTKLLPPVPEKGNFEVNTVKKSLYFFS